MRLRKVGLYLRSESVGALKRRLPKTAFHSGILRRYPVDVSVGLCNQVSKEGALTVTNFADVLRDTLILSPHRSKTRSKLTPFNSSCARVSPFRTVEPKQK